MQILEDKIYSACDEKQFPTKKRRKIDFSEGFFIVQYNKLKKILI